MTNGTPLFLLRCCVKAVTGLFSDRIRIGAGFEFHLQVGSNRQGQRLPDIPRSITIALAVALIEAAPHLLG